jgi:hypothetical protein
MKRIRRFFDWILADRRRQLVWLIGALIGFGTLVRIPQLFHNLAESYAFRQAQTAFTVREYAEHGINLFTTPLPVFGPHASVPMEFPLFQGIAALLNQVGLSTDLSARIVGLVSFQIVAVLLAVLLVRWNGRAVAVVAVALLEFLPFGLLWGSASLIDFFAVALALTMVVALDRWFSGGSGWWLALGSIAAILGFLVKVTTIPSWCFLLVAAAIFVIRANGWRASWRRLSSGFLLGPAAGLGFAIIWTSYADSVKRTQDLTLFLTSPALRNWNFGTLHQRVDPQNYLTILTRISQEIAGPVLVTLLLGVIAAVYLKSQRAQIATLAWIAVAVSAPLLFFNLYVVHTYYLIAIYPALVAIIAIGGVWAVRLIPGSAVQRRLVGILAIGLLLFSTVISDGGRGDVAQFAQPQLRPALSSLLLDQTEPDDLIVIVGCDWDPVFLYYADRKGVMFRDADSGTFWTTNKVTDYKYLYNCRADLKPNIYLPSGYFADPTDSPNFYRIEHATPTG